MNKYLTNNTMKVLSLVISFILWTYVVFVISPDVEITLRDVPVTYSGHQSLMENNYMISVQNNGSTTVDLKLRGPRSLLSRISKENITSYIDFSGYSTEGTYSLPIKVRLPYEEIEVYDKDPYNLTVSIEKLYEHSFDIEILCKGTPKEGYIIDPLTLKTGIKASIEGPEEIVKTIEKAVVEVDVGGAKGDVTAEAEVLLLNSNGDIIDKTQLTVLPETAEVTVGILKSAVVPITVDLQNDEYTAEIIGEQNIKIIGKAEEIDKITSLSTTPVEANVNTTEETVQADLVLPAGIRTEVDSPVVTVKITKKDF